ncbi:MAG: rRNA pseudouridine synthase [Paludibacter sp.]|nr:rRNA pseudouridine synthase [Bacteroidales bacterium]MCM1068970.1 rRNA pseudouridine synthase [Prevotella sp.]MCM1353633.1 rRNA pseudouridine synthase [Bacteroides sp.]MCM1442018.1 rRNA pseudouridine synthase [Muribaculum sp.]MCM1481526.1 rRNA pseudouridine synthase [Paludibacter sp.]
MDTNRPRWHSASGGRGVTDNRGNRYERYERSNEREDNYRRSTESRYNNSERRTYRNSSTPQEERSYRPRFTPDTEVPRPRRQRIGHTSERVQDEGYTPRYANNRTDNRQGGGYARQRSFGQSERREGNVYSKRKQFEYRQREVDPTRPMRLNKYLANAGICSRREADDFIQAGVITVNGEIVTMLGAKVMPTDKVMFHDQTIRCERKVYILLNKPKDCVTTTDDPQERKTVLDIVKNACAERIYPVGRLDRNTTGVLLLTNDGDLAAKLTHPKYGKKKIYAATLDRDLTDEDYQTIMNGITLDDEVIVPDALEFTHEEDRRHIGLEIHSGQNRVVRRIFEKVGYKVLQLDRVSFAGLTKKNVPRGKYRFLTPREVSMLQMGAFH